MHFTLLISTVAGCGLRICRFTWSISFYPSDYISYYYSNLHIYYYQDFLFPVGPAVYFFIFFCWICLLPPYTVLCSIANQPWDAFRKRVTDRVFMLFFINSITEPSINTLAFQSYSLYILWILLYVEGFYFILFYKTQFTNTQDYFSHFMASFLIFLSHPSFFIFFV